MLPPPCRDDEDVVCDPLRYAGKESGDELREPTAESSRLAAAVERAVGEVMGLDRPYLLLDVEPRMVQRADYCLLHRERLAQLAKAEWEKDTTGGPENVSLPPKMDGMNCRFALRAAQLLHPPDAAIIREMRSELSGKPSASKLEGGSCLKPGERAMYRLHPQDDVLEYKVLLAGCCLWVPLIPDVDVEGEPTRISWRRWLFEYAHASALNPHRSPGESFQILRRTGYWSTMGPDFNR